MEGPQRNLKRKRGPMEDFTGDESKIIGKLHHGLKEVKKAAKKAKAFETQRLVKKLKGLRKNEAIDSNIAEHETQLDIIKTIDHEIFANIAVKSKFAKDHLLSRHDYINEALSQEIGNKMLAIVPQDTTTGKAYSRLLSSKVLAAEVSSLCRVLHEYLDPEIKNNVEKGVPKNREEMKDAMREKTKFSKLVAVADSELDSHLGVDMVTRKESDPETEDHFDLSNELLSSAEEDDQKDSQIQDSDADDDYSIANKSAPSAPKPSGAESTFLPSLSVGFIGGSDDSDWSDHEGQITDPGQRKNRRGQRARRAIWEKKYGRNANHKIKELGASSKHRFPEDNRKVRRGPEQRLEKQADRFYGNTTSYSVQRMEDSHQQTKKFEERPLHPSWAAKRQMKEKQALGIVQSQGTKIKFTD